MFFVYILYSEKVNRYYVGYSENPVKRLSERHNAGRVSATKNGRPHTLLKTKEFKTETEARQDELRSKNRKSRIYIEELLKGNW